MNFPEGLISVKSPNCGAVGDGKTDDTAAIQTCLSYAAAHGKGVYFPTSSDCYLVTKSLNAGGNVMDLSLWGDAAGHYGNHESTICHALTEPYPVLDMSSCRACSIHNLAILPAKNDLANSQATAGVYAAPAKGNPPGNLDIFGSTIMAGKSSGMAGCVIAGEDISGIYDRTTCEGDSTGLVLGDGPGVTNGVIKSKFYTLGPGYGDTLLSVDNSIVAGKGSPVLQLTGSFGSYQIEGNTYIVMEGPGVAKGKIVEVSCSGSEGPTMEWLIARTENQTGAQGAKSLTALYLDNTCRIGGGDIHGVLAADPSGGAIGGPGQIVNTDINIMTSSNTNLFNNLGGMSDSVIRAWGSFGQIGNGGLGFSNNTIYVGVDSRQPLASFIGQLPTSAMNNNNLVCAVSSGGGSAGCQWLGTFNATNLSVNGTPLPLKGTSGRIGGAPVAGGACATGTASVKGATTSMVAQASPVTYPGAPFFWKAYVSAPDTVTVSVCTSLATGGTPAPSVYNVAVLP